MEPLGVSSRADSISSTCAPDSRKGGMRIDVISLLPQMLSVVTEAGVVGRAHQQGLWQMRVWNPRDYTEDPHRTVDDRPYGGGPGVVLMAAPLDATLRAVRDDQLKAGYPEPFVVYLSPQGRVLKHAQVLSLRDSLQDSGQGLVLLCGRYEGVDERLLEAWVDEELSLGDYVLSGGELAAMVLMDVIVRQLPGVLGCAHSVAEESFVAGLLEHPHYTRPEVYEGRAVPPVLLSGDHAQIAAWRKQQSLKRTETRRPDLLSSDSIASEYPI